jgi:hypothetical protein
MLTDTELWHRIEGLDLDNSGDEFPFSARLARDRDWSSEKTRAAIEEYKRFIYLSCIATSPLAPSKVVGQVWHGHILDTRSYWTGLCEGVLGRPIHRDPTEAGAARAYHVLDLYAATRSLYEREFDCAPPVEFWPLVSERSVAATDPRAADRGSCWIAPEPSGLGSILWCSAAALLALLASCGDLAAAVQADMAGGGSRWLMLLLAGSVAVVRILVRGRRRATRDDPGRHRRAGAYRRRYNGDGYWGCEG